MNKCLNCGEEVKNKICKSLKNYYMRDGVIGNIQDS